MAIAATTTMRGPMVLKDWAQLLLLGAIWGGSFFFARIAVSELPPLVLVLFRVAIAATALQLYLAVRGPSFRLALPHAGLFFLLALANNVIPFSLIFAGQTELGAGVASVLNSTTPFWTLILANALTSDEKLSWNKLAGIALGIAGTAVMIGPCRRARRAGLGEIRAHRCLGLLCGCADDRPPLQGCAVTGHCRRTIDLLDHHHDPGRSVHL